MITMGNLKQNGAEMFKSGSGGAMMITLTRNDSGDMIADKSYADIAAALEAGNVVCARISSVMPAVTLYTYAVPGSYMVGGAIGFLNISLFSSDMSQDEPVMDAFMATSVICDADDHWHVSSTVIAGELVQ